jgi:signal transduction histidine kinase
MEAATGREGLELAKRLPSVILLDVKLPDILGYEVCRRIKANPQTGHIPVLQLSASLQTSDSKVYALESGADAYLAQPIEPNVLIATVKSLVRLHAAETQAKLSARQWQGTFDALSEGVAIVDAQGLIQRCNRAMSTIVGWPYARIERQSLDSLLQERFGLNLRAESSMREEAQSGGRYFRFSLDPVILNEVYTGGIFIVSEISGQKRAEAALLANERLAATGRMANTIAHEINNPLESITNLLYLLRGAVRTPEVAREYLALADQELSRVSRIARQILSFNRESAMAVPANVADLLEDVLALNNRALAEKQLRIKKDWEGSYVVCGFPAQLRQVFSNLIRNAIEASFTGKEIRLRISGMTRWGEPAVRVTIHDHGIGIPNQARKQIFDAFFTTKELKGSGIGLWLSANIVQEHRGRIQVRSSTAAANPGTCVSVILPCKWQQPARA